MSRSQSLSLRILALVTATIAGITACQDQGPVQPLSNPNALTASDQIIPIKGKPQFYFNGIVFTGQQDAITGELYSMNPDGSNVSRLTVDDSIDLYPDVSPVASSIIWVKRANGSLVSDIYSMGLDGKNRKRLTFLNINILFPRYSPDGSKIAFAADLPNIGSEIFVMNANGSGITRLTFTAKMSTAPSWSPDGSKIAFTSFDNGSESVWTMTANGSFQAPLVTCASPGCAHPKWNPVTNEIAFDHLNQSGISVVNATTGAQTGYIPLSDHDVMGTWSKDGSTVIFMSMRQQNGGYDLWASMPMRRTMTAPPPVTRLTQFADNETWPAYSH